MNRKNSPFNIIFNRDLFPGKVEVDIMQMDSLDSGYSKQKCLEGTVLQAYLC